MIINKDFYIRQDVVEIARELLGKYIFTTFEGKLTGGIISETEAYAGVTDKGSHAYGDRRTKRTGIMYCEGGIAYVYLCYGIHSLFNIVTNKSDIPHAVLIRAIIPTDGLEIMVERAEKQKVTIELANGPGRVTKTLGIHFGHTGNSLTGYDTDNNKDKIWLEDKGIIVSEKEIKITPRIGIDYAEEDALLPYRFRISDFRFI